MTPCTNILHSKIPTPLYLLSPTAATVAVLLLTMVSSCNGITPVLRPTEGLERTERDVPQHRHSQITTASAHQQEGLHRLTNSYTGSYLIRGLGDATGRTPGIQQPYATGTGRLLMDADTFVMTVSGSPSAVMRPPDDAEPARPPDGAEEVEPPMISDTCASEVLPDRITTSTRAELRIRVTCDAGTRPSFEDQSCACIPDTKTPNRIPPRRRPANGRCGVIKVLRFDRIGVVLVIVSFCSAGTTLTLRDSTRACFCD